MGTATGCASAGHFGGGLLGGALTSLGGGLSAAAALAAASRSAASAAASAKVGGGALEWPAAGVLVSTTVTGGVRCVGISFVGTGGPELAAAVVVLACATGASSLGLGEPP